MIISYYGKKFLKKFNEVENKNLIPKEFFVEYFYPIFFGEENSLMEATNSPFTNAAYYLSYFMKSDLEKNGMKWDKEWFKKGELLLEKIPETEKTYLLNNLSKYKKERKEFVINKFIEKIENKEFDASMFLGGYAKDLCSTTSFNLASDYNNIIDENEVYYSWFGQALSLHIKGGINFLIDDENILYDIHLGWKRYRELLSDPLYKEYKGGQISTWNMHWLNNMYSPIGYYKQEKKFNPFETNANIKLKNLESISWVRFLFNLATKYPDSIKNAYAYKFGKTNETYGVMPIELKKISGFINFCYEYFGKNEFLNKSELYEKIYGTGYSVEKICEFGSIGLLALKPELLRLEEHEHQNEVSKKRINTLYKDVIENESIYKFYNTYLMATLNMKDIEKDIIEIAKSLYNFDAVTRKNNKVLVEELLSTKNLSGLLISINKMIEICDAENLQDNAKVLDKLMALCMSDESKLSNVILLIKFNFHKISLNNKAIK